MERVNVKSDFHTYHLCSSSDLRPNDNKLRKKLSLKLYFKYLEFYLPQCFNTLLI